MRKELLMAAIAAGSIDPKSLPQLNFVQAMRLVDIELTTESKFSCVRYLEKCDAISSDTAVDLNAEILRQATEDQTK